MNKDLTRLNNIKLDYSDSSKKLKEVLLRKLLKRISFKVEDLIEFHHFLLFNMAYPGNKTIQILCEKNLVHISKMVKGNLELSNELQDSGVSGSYMESSFTLTSSKWLGEKYSDIVRLKWKKNDLGDSFNEFLFYLLPKAEKDGLYKPKLKIKDWFSILKHEEQGDLFYLTQIFGQLKVPPLVLDYLFSSFNFTYEWNLPDLVSTSFNRIPIKRPISYIQKLKRSCSLSEECKRKLPERAIQLDKETANKFYDFGLHTLLARGREIDPVVHANLSETYQFHLEDGMDITFYGTNPKMRLPIESYFAFIYSKNGIPLGYGGVWVFGEKAEVGFNLFDSYRGSETQHCYAQILRITHQFFGANAFFIDPYQMGGDNEEALLSGAFWFYYRLGFRPVDEKVRKEADKEFEKILKLKKYRSSIPKLKRLTSCKAFWNLDPNKKALETLDLSDLGLSTSIWIGEKFNGDRNKAITYALNSMNKLGGLNLTKYWNSDEKKSFEEFSLLLCRMNYLKKLSIKERKEIFEIVKAKGGTKELLFLKKIKKNKEFQHQLKILASISPEFKKFN